MEFALNRDAFIGAVREVLLECAKRGPNERAGVINNVAVCAELALRLETPTEGSVGSIVCVTENGACSEKQAACALAREAARAVMEHKWRRDPSICAAAEKHLDGSFFGDDLDELGVGLCVLSAFSLLPEMLFACVLSQLKPPSFKTWILNRSEYVSALRNGLVSGACGMFSKNEDASDLEEEVDSPREEEDRLEVVRPAELLVLSKDDDKRRAYLELHANRLRAESRFAAANEDAVLLEAMERVLSDLGLRDNARVVSILPYERPAAEELLDMACLIAKHLCVPLPHSDSNSQLFTRLAKAALQGEEEARTWVERGLCGRDVDCITGLFAVQGQRPASVAYWRLLGWRMSDEEVDRATQSEEWTDWWSGLDASKRLRFASLCLHSQTRASLKMLLLKTTPLHSTGPTGESCTLWELAFRACCLSRGSESAVGFGAELPLWSEDWLTPLQAFDRRLGGTLSMWETTSSRASGVAGTEDGRSSASSASVIHSVFDAIHWTLQRSIGAVGSSDASKREVFALSLRRPCDHDVCFIQICLDAALKLRARQLDGADDEEGEGRHAVLGRAHPIEVDFTRERADAIRLSSKSEVAAETAQKAHHSACALHRVAQLIVHLLEEAARSHVASHVPNLLSRRRHVALMLCGRSRDATSSSSSSSSPSSRSVVSGERLVFARFLTVQTASAYALPSQVADAYGKTPPPPVHVLNERLESEVATLRLPAAEAIACELIDQLCVSTRERRERLLSLYEGAVRAASLSEDERKSAEALKVLMRAFHGGGVHPGTSDEEIDSAVGWMRDQCDVGGEKEILDAVAKELLEKVDALKTHAESEMRRRVAWVEAPQSESSLDWLANEAQKDWLLDGVAVDPVSVHVVETVRIARDHLSSRGTYILDLRLDPLAGMRPILVSWEAHEADLHRDVPEAHGMAQEERDRRQGLSRELVDRGIVKETQEATEACLEAVLAELTP